MRHIKKRTILAYLDKELKEKQRKKAEEHFESCAECQIQEKLILEERQLVKERVELLTPERITQILPFTFNGRKAEIYTKPFFRRLILASVKVPVAFLVLIGAAFLAMSIILFSKKGEPRVSEKRYEKETGRITLICQESRMSFSIGVKLTGFLPILNPKLLVTEEDKQ